MTITPGARYTVKKGSVVHSFNPSKEEYTLARSQKVKVKFFDPGYKGDGYYDSRPAKVTWAGTGGYWCWTNAENVITEKE